MPGRNEASHQSTVYDRKGFVWYDLGNKMLKVFPVSGGGDVLYCWKENLRKGLRILRQHIRTAYLRDVAKIDNMKRRAA